MITTGLTAAPQPGDPSSLDRPSAMHGLQHAPIGPPRSLAVAAGSGAALIADEASDPEDVAADAPSSDGWTAGWDVWLMGATSALLVLGLVMVVSASSHYAVSAYGSPWGYGARQLVGLLLGVGLGAVAIVLPWQRFVALSRPAWWATAVMMAAVQTPLGHAAKGAPRWISLGPLNLQPSELAKVALAMVLADHFARNEGRIRDVVGVAGSAVIAWLLPMLVLVHLQTDLGSMLLMCGVAGVALFVAGLELRWMAAALGLGAGGAALAVLFEPFRVRRFMTFLDPHADPEGAGYQIVQGWVAMAVGSIRGQGLGNGVAQQGFLPEAHTDMIMAVIAEELGVFGWSAVMILHVVVLWRGMVIATRASGLYEMILASCLSALIGVQVFINTAVIGGLLPPKGLVLPFVSYGASAVIANVFAVAVLLRIGREGHRRRVEDLCSASV